MSLEPSPEQTGDDVADMKLFTNGLEIPRSLHSLIKTYFKEGLIKFWPSAFSLLKQNFVPSGDGINEVMWLPHPCTALEIPYPRTSDELRFLVLLVTAHIGLCEDWHVRSLGKGSWEAL